MLRLLFTFERPVDRRTYVVAGLLLAALKYAVDFLLVYAIAGKAWSPVDYFSPVSSLASVRLGGAPPFLLPLLALWSLPFLWIGVTMTMRRALDAGHSAWFALLFFVPALNYVLFAILSLTPTDVTPRAPAVPERSYERQLPRALLAMSAGAALALGMLALSVYGLASYGIPLFLGTPFVIGALTAYLFNRRYAATLRESHQVVFMTFALVAGALMLTAAEGALCLLMAMPLALGIGAMGTVLGRRIALHDPRTPRNALLAVLVLPVTAVMEADRPASAVREVRSSIIVNASAATVWRNVIAFPPLPEPSDVVFRLGIAYPQRADIVGEGVGAIRYCRFSTGDFVEPITAWEPGRRLAFDVRSQPRPLQEWSPYDGVVAPHLDGYLLSKRGEFRLVALPDGRTRLEGSTWYETRLEPAGYWALFGDAIIGRIHHRVLDHVRRTSEGS